jgi:putative membrane protein
LGAVAGCEPSWRGGDFGADSAEAPGSRTAARGKINRMGPFLIRAALTGVALWLVTLLIPGVSIVGGDTTLQTAGIVFVVAVIFGVVNAVIKPIVQFIAIPLYILTLGLFHIVVNALMLWITAWITEHTTHWGLAIDRFWWTAIWAAIMLSIISWLLSLLVGDLRRSAAQT